MRARCRCGRVVLEASRPHIVHLCCYCDDCQTAADLIDALPGGMSGRGPDGGTPHVLFRRDRVHVVSGDDVLKAYRVRRRTRTRRMVASCCNTAMFQIHDNSFPYRGIKSHLFDDPVPPVTMRIFTKFAPEPRRIPRDVKSSRTVPLSLAISSLRAMAELQWKSRRKRHAVRETP